jgi:hypothetical protein
MFSLSGKQLFSHTVIDHSMHYARFSAVSESDLEHLSNHAQILFRAIPRPN